VERLNSGRLNQSVQEQIKLYILEAGLKAGDLIPTEKELGEQLGISRTSIREALRSLEAIGIIESKHGVGRFLREFNYDAILQNLGYNIQVNVQDFREIIEVRVALEQSFVEQVAGRIKPHTIEELHRIVGTLDELIATGRPEEELINTHTQFHMKLYESMENTLLLHLIRLFSTVQMSLTQADKYHTSDLSEFADLHRGIVEAVELGDGALAKARMMEHFKDVIAWGKEHQGSGPPIEAITNGHSPEGGEKGKGRGHN
jgi:DNA-binding FadR family transcriptional regulator